MIKTAFFIGLFTIGITGTSAQQVQTSNVLPSVTEFPDTLPSLKDGQTPQNFGEMWSDFDPRGEPLEIETLKQWEEDRVVLRIVRFRIGVFKGTVARLAAVYGFPKNVVANTEKVPGLLQIHGGGQYADYKACLANAKRGYATLSIAWAGRISAPDYRVNPEVVKLFWGGKTDDPSYRLTTDWAAVDGYHAPGRNPGNQFPSAKAAAWTLDRVESPRNSGWFLCALAARRALTFLEQQSEVDAGRLGVYGHSMGGKLTVMTAVDSRVKAAAPSCGGISDRDNDSPLFRATLGDDVSLKKVSCPIIFLSPANDFHGRISDLPAAVNEIAASDWRVTCSPHHNHQDTPPYEVASLLWFDQHLKGKFEFPRTPSTSLQLKTTDGTPTYRVKPDSSKPVLSVDVFYTQQGKGDEQPEDSENTKHRFWHHAPAVEENGTWAAKLPLGNADKPLWVYANVVYPLDSPVNGVGYYYGDYTTKTFNLSSVLTTVKADELRSAGVREALEPSLMIEDFQGDWRKEWFTYKPNHWSRTTNKLHDETWQAPVGASLTLDVLAKQPNTLVVMIDDHVAEVPLKGGDQWQQITLEPKDFRKHTGVALTNWKKIKFLKLSDNERLNSGNDNRPRIFGKAWEGPEPQFRNLRWHLTCNFLDDSQRSIAKSDYVWTTNHMHVGVRWQPFIGYPQNNAFDATRPVIARDSSYVQFWVSWQAVEPTTSNTDYVNQPSLGMQAIEHAVNECSTRGLKVEFVFFHCPAWASESGQAGGFKPKAGLFEEYVRRVAVHFKGRVHAYQLSHEANNDGLMKGADVNFMINDILLKGAQTVRSVYEAQPAVPVLVSTTGMSPCEMCAPRPGLDGKGAKAVDRFYDLMIANQELMRTVDALNMNVSDHDTGYGNMDGKIIPSVWVQYDLVRQKLDTANLRAKSILSSESWIVWDDAKNAHDINGDGKKDEKDAYLKAITIFGQCLQRGLNTINLPWSDNTSGWAMGLTKRRDYNGRIRELMPEIVIAANDGGPDIVTRKIGMRGSEDSFTIVDGEGNVFTIDDYIHPPDPNHLHYYIWKWYAQIAGGSDEVIRHAVAGEDGNDIVITGDAFAGSERYRISSFNRTRNRFTVLVYASGADTESSATVTIPSKIINGKYYNNETSALDFRGEGFATGDTYYARVISKNISIESGSDVSPVYFESDDTKVTDDVLTVHVPKMNRFTAIEFVKRDRHPLKDER